MNLIVAMNFKNVIGHDNKLPWPRISCDLKHFKNLTENNILIMGRKTFESIPKFTDRQMIVVSSTLKWTNLPENVYICDSIPRAIKIAEKLKDESKSIWVIGGNQIYKQMIKHCDTLYITRINHDCDGDTLFEHGLSDFIKIDEKIETEKGIDCYFQKWERKLVPEKKWKFF